MKLIKKIAAIMFAFMMVFSLSTNAKAETGSQTTSPTGGSITINNTIDGEEYKIYKIFGLESYDTEPADKKGAYSYTMINDWNDFFTKEGKIYATEDGNGYVKSNITDSNAAEFAQKALAYAQSKPVTVTETVTGNGDAVTVKGLAYGYYLVGSGVGSLCGLNTTNPNAEIYEKNGVPKVEKHVSVNNEDYATYNYANIGDVLTFQTTIHVKKGAKKYILHDTMSTGLLLKANVNEGSQIPTVSILQVYAQGDEGPEGEFHILLKEGIDYNVVNEQTGFTATFSDVFLKTYENYDYTMNVTYRATLTKDAKISSSETLKANTNTTYLKYGDNKTSNKPETQTYTCGIPVYKFTKKFGTDKALAGAEFKLFEDDKTTEIGLVDTGNIDKATYRRFMTGDTDDQKVTTIKTNGSGKFDITGLKLGTYYLQETKAPDGYNRLTSKIKVEITKDADGKPVIYVNDDNINKQEEVKVENSAGSLLPSTGGMGTTLIYLVGGALVLGSGFVLANKKRAKAK